MFIGFTERKQTVSEGEAQPEEFISITVNVSIDRISEIDYNVFFRYQDVTSSAIVEPLSSNDVEYDALFGERLDSDEPIQELQEIEAGRTSTSIQLLIFNDLIPEEEECFTLRIIPADSLHPECNEHGDSFFCEHTICITDDDGKYKLMMEECIILYLTKIFCHCKANVLHVLLLTVKPLSTKI